MLTLRPANASGRLSGESGYALPLMLAVLALGSILVAATFLMARLESQSGENTLVAARAYETAESGLAEIVAWWDSGLYDTLSTGDSVTVPLRLLGPGTYRGSVRRLSRPLFAINVVGLYPNPPFLLPARRGLISIARLVGSDPGIHAALTVRDSLTWDAPSSISGDDSIPPGWATECPGVDSSVAAVLYAPSVMPSFGACAGPPCLTGNPASAVDSSIADSTFLRIGGVSYASLSARATWSPVGTLGPIGPVISAAPGSCVLTDSLNWGEPDSVGSTAACRRFFPVIHSPGDLVLTGGRGQGLLLVDGDLTMGGGTAFTGLIVVLGTFTNAAGGGSVLGGVMAHQIALADPSPSASLKLHYSACVLPNTVRGSALVTPLPYRSWTQAF